MIGATHLEQLDFNNTEIAFRNKSDMDLEKAYWLFKLVSSNTLIKICTPLTNFGLRIGLPLELIIRNTIYKQFCGGESIEDCEPAMKELKRSKVTTILDYSVEGKAAEEIGRAHV